MSELRTNWLMRQFCDETLARFARGEIGYLKARLVMRERMVPTAVAKRLLQTN